MKTDFEKLESKTCQSCLNKRKLKRKKVPESNISIVPDLLRYINKVPQTVTESPETYPQYPHKVPQCPQTVTESPHKVPQYPQTVTATSDFDSYLIDERYDERSISTQCKILASYITQLSDEETDRKKRKHDIIKAKKMLHNLVQPLLAI
jgi:hypothetical protein